MTVVIFLVSLLLLPACQCVLPPVTLTDAALVCLASAYRTPPLLFSPASGCACIQQVSMYQLLHAPDRTVLYPEEEVDRRFFPHLECTPLAAHVALPSYCWWEDVDDAEQATALVDCDVSRRPPWLEFSDNSLEATVTGIFKVTVRSAVAKVFTRRNASANVMDRLPLSIYLGSGLQLETRSSSIGPRWVVCGHTLEVGETLSSINGVRIDGSFNALEVEDEAHGGRLCVANAGTTHSTIRTSFAQVSFIANGGMVATLGDGVGTVSGLWVNNGTGVCVVQTVKDDAGNGVATQTCLPVETDHVVDHPVPAWEVLVDGEVRQSPIVTAADMDRAAWDGALLAQSDDFERNEVDIVTPTGHLLKLLYRGGLVTKARAGRIGEHLPPPVSIIVHLECSPVYPHGCGDEAAAAAALDANFSHFIPVAVGAGFAAFNGPPEHAHDLAARLATEPTILSARVVSSSWAAEDCPRVDETLDGKATEPGEPKACVSSVVVGGVGATEATIGVILERGHVVRAIATRHNYAWDEFDLESTSPLDDVHTSETGLTAVSAAQGVQGEDGAPDSAPPAHRTVQLYLGGLHPNTTYDFYLQVDSTPLERQQAPVGRFTTAGRPGHPYSFTFGAGSGVATGSEHRVFRAIRHLLVPPEAGDGQPDDDADDKSDQADTTRLPPAHFFAHLGSLQSSRLTSAHASDHRAAYHASTRSISQLQLTRHLPLVYTWADGDFSPTDPHAADDAGSRATAAAVRTAVREALPSHALPDAQATFPHTNRDAAIYHAFTMGRVRFIVLDTRSSANPANGTLLGSAQHSWLLYELHRLGSPVGVGQVAPKLAIVLSGAPWVGPAVGSGAEPRSDPFTLRNWWWEYWEERAAIARAIESAPVPVLLVTGGLGGIAVDLGENSNFATTNATIGSAGGPPVVTLGALDPADEPAMYGGPYSAGCRRASHEFGRFAVEDVPSLADDEHSSLPCVHFTAHTADDEDAESVHDPRSTELPQFAFSLCADGTISSPSLPNATNNTGDAAATPVATCDLSTCDGLPGHVSRLCLFGVTLSETPPSTPVVVALLSVSLLLCLTVGFLLRKRCSRRRLRVSAPE